MGEGGGGVGALVRLGKVGSMLSVYAAVGTAVVSILESEGAL